MFIDARALFKGFKKCAFFFFLWGVLMSCDWSNEMRENSGNAPEHISKGVARVMLDLKKKRDQASELKPRGATNEPPRNPNG